MGVVAEVEEVVKGTMPPFDQGTVGINVKPLGSLEVRPGFQTFASGKYYRINVAVVLWLLARCTCVGETIIQRIRHHLPGVHGVNVICKCDGSAKSSTGLENMVPFSRSLETCGIHCTRVNIVQRERDELPSR